MKMRGRVQRNQDTQTGAKPNKFAEKHPGRLSAKRPGKLAARLGGILLAAAMLLTLLPGTAASADSYQSSYPSVPENPATIPVSQTVSGGGRSFRYTLTPEGENAPMPEKSTNGKYTFSLDGNDTFNIVIPSSEPGVWYYTLTAETKNGYDFNAKKYRLGVEYYTDGTSLKANINAWADGTPNDQKAKEVTFNISKVKTEQSAPKPNPGTPSKASKTGLVKTGDSSQIGLYAGLLVAAGAALIILIVWRRRKRA